LISVARRWAVRTNDVPSLVLISSRLDVCRDGRSREARVAIRKKEKHHGYWNCQVVQR
jgi:hypothetical protein